MAKMSGRRVAAAAACLVAASALGAARANRRSPAQEQAPSERPIPVTASRYKFDPPRIEVTQDDLVVIDLKTTDIAHSFTIDAYRIAKRAGPGHPAHFEFRADKAGTFPFYCNLQIDEGCRQMRGELVVKPRK
jgi:cytochrome c oxidase subunit 2